MCKPHYGNSHLEMVVCKWKAPHCTGRLYWTFLKNFFSNFSSHIKDSKWGRKCTFINCTSCNRSPQQIPFQFANGKLPHSCCRAFWAVSYGLEHVTAYSRIQGMISYLKLLLISQYFFNIGCIFYGMAVGRNYTNMHKKDNNDLTKKDEDN